MSTLMNISFPVKPQLYPSRLGQNLHIPKVLLDKIRICIPTTYGVGGVGI